MKQNEGIASSLVLLLAVMAGTLWSALGWTGTVAAGSGMVLAAIMLSGVAALLKRRR